MRTLIVLILSLNLLLSCNSRENQVNSYPQNYNDTYLPELPLTNEEREQEAYEDAVKSMSISSLTAYAKEYPEGKYREEVKSIKDSLWDEGIADYVEQAKSSKDKKAVRFFKKVLEYMKENNTNEIELNLIKKIDLKNYNDYSKDVQGLMAKYYDSPPLSSKNIISPTSLVGKGSTDIWLIMGISQDMKHDLFKITYPEDRKHDLLEINHPAPSEAPLSMTIEYTIKNQEEDKFPEIWTYSEDNVFKSYLLGIAIDFKLTFTIANTKSKYVLNAHEDPSGNIGEVLNILDGYGAMTEKTFVQFSNDVVSRFGFEANYEGMHEKMMQGF
jgi:hypothetical protein